MNNPENDGITHINVYSKGKTELGRWLSNFAFTPVYLGNYGHFASIEGYWYWLTRQDERLRHLHGFAAKKLGRELPAVKEYEDGHFKDLIESAIEVKIDSYPDKQEEFFNNTLPLDHYYVFGDKVVDAGHRWIIDYLEEIRNE